MAVDRDRIAKSALKFTQKGQFPKAIAEYQKLLSADPRDIRIRLKLLDLYGRAGRTQEAMDECLHVAESYSDQGFYLKAIAVYKQALRISPDDPLLYKNMGEMYVKQGLIGDALGYYKRGVDLLRKQDRKADAEDLLVRMEEMAPENAAIKIHLAELYLEEGRYPDFSEILGKLILQLRGEGRSRKLLQAVEGFYEKSQHHPSVLKRLAELYVELGEEDKALVVIREGLAGDPASRDLRLLGLRANLVSGQLADARRMALALMEEDPGDLNILEQLASIAQARNDRAELAQAYKAMAKVYGARGLHQKEELCFRKVQELYPDDAEARLALGEVMIESAPEDAEPEYGDSIWVDQPTAAETGPEVDQDGLVEADLYLKYGMEEKAAAKLRELADLTPDDLEIRTRLRDLCQRRGDRTGWVREQLQIADLFLREKRENEALRAFESILEVDPENTEARKSINYLKPNVVDRPSSIEINLDAASLEFVGEGGEEQVVRHREAERALADEDDENLLEGLAEADFYEAQGLTDEATKALLRLKSRYPASAHIESRLTRLGYEAPDEEELDEGFVDLQSEVLDAADLSLASGFEGFRDFEVSELDDIVREFKSGIAERLDGGDYETHYNLGVAYREMGLMEDAVEEFQIAARSPEKAREAYTSMSLAFRDLDRGEDAHAALRMALAIPSNSPEDRVAILFEMGTLSELDEDWYAALNAFRKAADIDPSHRDLMRRIERLQARVQA